MLVAKDSEIRPELQTWGYKMPDFLVINAQSETAAEKPMFRERVAAKRCIVLLSGFFEWKREKQKYYFRLQGEDALYTVGLFTIRNGVPYYCILTTATNESMKEIHHRMPLVLRRPGCNSRRKPKSFLP